MASGDDPGGAGGVRFWRLYVAAWMPLLAIYTLMFTAEYGVARALGGALESVLPEAIFGLGVIAISRRLAWQPDRRSRFFALHAVAGLGYGLTCSVVITGLYQLHRLGAGEVVELNAMTAIIMGWQVFIALLLYAVIASATYAVRLLDRLRRQEAETARAQALATAAELKALRAQLNPHFLFNTLHSLLALVRREPARAEEALEQFGDLLRYSLRVQRDERDTVRLAEEWEFVRNYLELERLRLGERLRLRLEVDDDALDCAVPAFSLQPLVENAIQHAIAPRAAGGEVRIRIAREGAELVCAVSDDGPGADPSALDRPRGEGDGGLGLALVRQRLALLRGGAGRLEVRTAPGQGFAVTMRLVCDGGAPT